MSEQRTEYDNPWKEIIEDFFPNFLEFFFPTAYAVIDWTKPYEFLDTELLMSLPEELANNFKTELRNDEEAGRMRYVTSIKRLAKQEGRVETARESIIEVLEVRFGEIPNTIWTKINGINDVSMLKTIHRQAIAIPSLDAFLALIDEISL